MPSPGASAEGSLVTVVLDLATGPVSLSAGEVARLRDAAAARAGRSSAARDLSLLLQLALERIRPVALRRAEVETLVGIALDADLDRIAAKLTTPGTSAA
jgi:hypothetical protein